MTDAFAASLIFRAIGWALMQSLWQGAIVGVVTACALLAFRRSAANHRYTVACLGLAALVVVPVVTAALHARELRTSGIRIDLAAPVFISPDGRPVAAPDLPPDAGSRRTSNAPAMRVTGRWPDERLEEWSLIAVPLWLIGVLALSSRLVAGWLAVERVRRAAARPVSEAWLSRVKTMADRLRVARPVRVVESAVVNSPMVVGWLRPVILLPASALTGLAPSQLEAVIAHELAHIRRHDYLVNLFQSTVETLLFYHPASWWISRQIRVEREHCCDDMAVELCGDRLTYARALADLEQMRGADMKLALAATRWIVDSSYPAPAGCGLDGSESFANVGRRVCGPHGPVAHGHARRRDERPGVRRGGRHSRTGPRRSIGTAAGTGDGPRFRPRSGRERHDRRRRPIRSGRAEGR